MKKTEIIDYLKFIEEKHYNWIESMNWHNKSHLENLALIYSEIGEASIEQKKNNHEKLSEECADIVLRLIDFSYGNKFDLLKINKSIDSSHIDLTDLSDNLSFVCNHVRYKEIDMLKFEESTLLCFSNILDFTLKNNIDLIGNIEMKMNKNLKKGNKGRFL